MPELFEFSLLLLIGPFSIRRFLRLIDTLWSDPRVIFIRKFDDVLQFADNLLFFLKLSFQLVVALIIVFILLLVLVLKLLLLPDLRLGLGTGGVGADPIMMADVRRPDFNVDIFALMKHVLAGVDRRGRPINLFILPVGSPHDIGGMHWRLV